MATPSAHTAILLFIRSESEEATAKQFGQSLNFKQNRQVAQLLNQQIHSTAQKSGLPTFVFSSKNQTGETFGERLGNAMQEVFEKGFEKVISIGNDCLDIQPITLQETAESLNHQEVVIGPCYDGGVYLLGVQRAAFDLAAFQKLPWQTPALQSGLKDYCQTLNLKTDLLKCAKDADDPLSFEYILRTATLHTSLKKILLNLLFAKRIVAPSFIFHRPTTNLLLQFHLRGPPIFSFC